VIDKQAMLEAHVQHELQQYMPERLPQLVTAESDALFAWLRTVQVNEVVQPGQVSAWVQRSVLERPLPPEVVDFVQENVVVALELMQDDQSRVRELLPKDVFDHAVEVLANMDDMRRLIIHQVVSSSVYSRLVANVLYHGIKSFLVTENGMARAIPGASSLLRFSQNALNATVPQMEKNVDKQLVAFIDENIQQTIADSEAFLNRSLDDALLHNVGDELWSTLSEETLARLSRPLTKDSIVESSAVVQEAWEHLRGTAIVQDIAQAVVRGFFLRYGKQDVAGVLKAAGLDQKAVTEGLLEVVVPLAQRARAGGYLEERIRARLTPFYDQYFA
jgi:hypothetical protein